MMAPLPTPTQVADRPELPRVRLEVRAASGRPVTYEVGAEDFLIGGSAGCDLRLPASNLPPVICQISRKADGVRVRRLTPVIPVHVNGNPLAANTTTPVASGDVLALAEIEITVAIQQTTHVVIPKFVPLEVESVAAPSHAPRMDLSEERRKLEGRWKQSTRKTRLGAKEWSRRRGTDSPRATSIGRPRNWNPVMLWYSRQKSEQLERQQASPASSAFSRISTPRNANSAV